MKYELIHGDCLDVMARMEAGSINLIATDLPYMNVKTDLAWDCQWPTRDAFLAWVGRVCDEWKRLLAPNGSVYAFASPQMAWHVEGVMRARFNVLNRITWIKKAGWHQKSSEESLRCYFPQTEPIFFAEHGNDGICDPAIDYLNAERERAGVTVRQVAEAFQRKTGSRTVTGMAGHWFTRVQWCLPTAENYEWLRQTLRDLNHNGDYLRREYEDLRREYEDLRRPFNATPHAPYTDVWTFPTVNAYPGKHPTEKPLSLLEHIVSLSSRPGDTVLDCCMGHGTCGIAAGNLGRKFVGIELDAGYFAEASTRIAAAYGDWDKARKVRKGKPTDLDALPLFA